MDHPMTYLNDKLSKQTIGCGNEPVCLSYVEAIDFQLGLTKSSWSIFVLLQKEPESGLEIFRWFPSTNKSEQKVLP